MPSIGENRANWDDPRNWQQHGEEWSHSWGGTESLWFGSILPRLAPMLPAKHLLEIACGHGRVTAHLLEHCERYTGVDLAASCVGVCRERFAQRANASFHLTDGRSLDVVDDGSVDVAFSWDSLVHAEEDAMRGYVQALANKLRPGGVAWLHHSNLGAFVDGAGVLTVENVHWRATSMSAERLREFAAGAGLHCLCQELVQWGGAIANDCFSLLQRPEGGAVAPTPVLHTHADFGREIEHFRQLDALYRVSLRRARS